MVLELLLSESDKPFFGVQVSSARHFASCSEHKVGQTAGTKDGVVHAGFILIGIDVVVLLEEHQDVLVLQCHVLHHLEVAVVRVLGQCLVLVSHTIVCVRGTIHDVVQGHLLTGTVRPGRESLLQAQRDAQVAVAEGAAPRHIFLVEGTGDPGQARQAVVCKHIPSVDDGDVMNRRGHAGGQPRTVLAVVFRRPEQTGPVVRAVDTGGPLGTPDDARGMFVAERSVAERRGGRAVWRSPFFRRGRGRGARFRRRVIGNSRAGPLAERFRELDHPQAEVLDHEHLVLVRTGPPRGLVLAQGPLDVVVIHRAHAVEVELLQIREGRHDVPRKMRRVELHPAPRYFCRYRRHVEHGRGVQLGRAATDGIGERQLPDPRVQRTVLCGVPEGPRSVR
mmetsp:Transcript_29416/g.58334  ORF Transcript_29416/g.58334 Transcript_29416/m.58334 type:complete len:392 (+) Transcript_29416:240-1415(+)